VKTALCIPTLNAGSHAAILAAVIASQTLQPDEILVIDSGSNDDTVETFRRAGAKICSIDRRDFNHGGTRQLGVDKLDDADLIIFLTQDAVPAQREAFERLIACFEDASVGAAFGRQLPHPEAGPIATHARLFNYPDASRTVTLGDRDSLGIKAVFLSNSFAAYRRVDLLAAHGFPSNLIMGEDTSVAAKMLLAGKKIAYRADASVFHSHDYGLMEEFRRYFDTGVLHAREPWIRQQFGGPGGEGLRFLGSEIRYLLRENPLLVPSSMVRNVLKFLGFRLGLCESTLPLPLKRQLSMLKSFWGA
jgi:rhamnosyltransferase